MKRRTDDIRRKMRPDEIRQTERLIRSGLSIAEIAAATGFSESAVRYRRKRNGMPGERQHWTEEKIERLCHWYERGTDVEAIVFHFRTSTSVLYFHLLRRGIPLRYPARSSRVRAAGEGKGESCLIHQRLT